MSKSSKPDQYKEDKPALSLYERWGLEGQPCSLYERWELEGQPCSLVRFQTAVPRAVNEEPVYEFRLESKDQKYVVERITDTPHGIIFRCKGELDRVHSANVVYTRSIQVKT